MRSYGSIAVSSPKRSTSLCEILKLSNKNLVDNFELLRYVNIQSSIVTYYQITYPYTNTGISYTCLDGNNEFYFFLYSAIIYMTLLLNGIHQSSTLVKRDGGLYIYIY